MPYKQLFFLIEGLDDRDFFNKILKPIFEEGPYDYAKPWMYAGETIEDRADFIKSVNSMKADYIVSGDINTHPCITAKKEALKSKFSNEIFDDRIIVVIREIESWLLAGLDDTSLKKVGLSKSARKKLTTTHNITKEDFEELIPRGKTRGEFVIAIFKNYNLAIAKEKNDSIKYLLDKWPISR